MSVVTTVKPQVSHPLEGILACSRPPPLHSLMQFHVIVEIFGRLRVVGHGYCVAIKECADLGFVVN